MVANAFFGAAGIRIRGHGTRLLQLFVQYPQPLVLTGPIVGNSSWCCGDFQIPLDSLAITSNDLENVADEVFRAPKGGAPLCLPSWRRREYQDPVHSSREPPVVGDDAIPVLEEETASACLNRRLRAASPAYKKWNFMTSRAFLYIMGSPSHRLTAITGMASLARAAIVGSQPKVLFQNVRGEDPFVVNCGFL